MIWASKIEIGEPLHGFTDFFLDKQGMLIRGKLVRDVRFMKAKELAMHGSVYALEKYN